jgi:hypothetical protein
VADHSYAAAEQPGTGRTVSHGDVALDERAKRGGEHPDARLAIGRHHEVFDARAVEPATVMPSPLNRCTRPGPRTETPAMLFVVIPASPFVVLPPHPVTASPLPVMVKPFRRSSTPGTPNEKHGVAFATSHVTSPMRSVSSTMTYVRVRVPLTRSAAEA